MSVLFVRPGGLRTCRASRFYAPYNVLGKEVKSVRKLRVLFLSLTWGLAVLAMAVAAGGSFTW